MPGIEVRAGGHPVVASCEIFNHKSNGVYVHKHGRGVFHGCRIFENELPGIAIRTNGNPLIHACSVVTGKDSALMVCDKGKGIILESALKGYSARPLEIRDSCNPIIQFCELHDGKHRHVMEWLQQIPKVIKPVDIEALGWSDEQLRAEDAEVMESSPLCREIDTTGPILIIGEDKIQDTTDKQPTQPMPTANPHTYADAVIPVSSDEGEIRQKEKPVDSDPTMLQGFGEGAKKEEPEREVEEEQTKPKKKTGKKGSKGEDGAKKASVDDGTSSITITGDVTGSEPESAKDSVTGSSVDDNKPGSTDDAAAKKKDNPSTKKSGHHHKESSQKRLGEKEKARKKSKSKPKQ